MRSRVIASIGVILVLSCLPESPDNKPGASAFDLLMLERLRRLQPDPALSDVSCAHGS